MNPLARLYLFILRARRAMAADDLRLMEGMMASALRDQRERVAELEKRIERVQAAQEKAHA